MIEDIKLICRPALESMCDICTANDANDETVLIRGASKILTSSSKQFRLLGVEISWVRQESICSMLLKACGQVHHAEVVERALFATRNSLKSHKERKLLSPI